MDAEAFNKAHPIGTVFIHAAHPALRGGHTVRTVAKAQDFNCGCVVEINREPYFVKVETLRKAG